MTDRDNTALPRFLWDVGVRCTEVNPTMGSQGVAFRKGHHSLPKILRGGIMVGVELSYLGRLVTLIHEYLHFLYPNESEAFVQADERRLLNLLAIPLSEVEGYDNLLCDACQPEETW